MRRPRISVLNTVSIASVSLLLAVASSLSSQAAQPILPDCYSTYPDYTLERFHDQENQMLHWERIYRSSPSGSQQERQADIKRRASLQAALDQLRYPQGLLTYSHVQIDDFAAEVEAKYRAAPSQSIPETLYNESRRLAMQAFTTKAQENIRCDARYTDELVRAGLTLDQLYRAAPSQSLREAVYSSLRGLAFDEAEYKLEPELRASRMDFRMLENKMIESDRQYRSAPSGSRQERFYVKAREISYRLSIEEFGVAANYMTYRELVSIDQEYDSKYRSAPSGSLIERHALEVRGIARAKISRPPPPPPPPVCPPGTRWDPRLQRCVAVRPVPPPPPPGPSRCPPGTIWDPRIMRCVAR